MSLERPIFVLATSWRSGSTWLQRMLSREAFLWGEPYGHAHIVPDLARQAACLDDGWPPERFRDNPDTTPDRGGAFIANLSPEPQHLLAAHRALLDRLLVEPLRERIAAGTLPPRWGVKAVRWSVEEARHLRRLYPEATLVVLHRHPVDAARSLAARIADGWTWYDRWPDRPLDVTRFARHWERLTRSLTDAASEVDACVVSYDDLRAGRFGPLEAHLGFAVDREAAARHVDDGGPRPLAELSNDDAATLRTICGPLAARLGYDMPEGSAAEASDEAIACGVRQDVRRSDGEETATCGLLAAIAGHDRRVPRAACLACEFREAGALVASRPVFASLAFEAAPPDSPIAVAAERTLTGAAARTRLHETVACDLVVPCSGEAACDLACIESLMEQDRAWTVLHLIGEVTDAVRARSEGESRIRLTGDATPNGWAAACDRLETLATGFVAVVSPEHPIDQTAVFEAVQRLTAGGHEYTPLRPDRADDSEAAFDRAFARGGVARRAALADQGDARFPDAAAMCGWVRRWHRIDIARPPRRPPRLAAHPIRCDVVLPFHGQLGFVREAIDGLLAQRGAEAIIHLVDDATPEPTDPFLREWASHPQVRTYRNRTNRGQFASFNAVAQHFETPYAAVQDADDISQPHRLAWSIAMLERSGADLFAGAVELFGLPAIVAPTSDDCDTFTLSEMPPHRFSFYPPLERVRYFAENPTLLMRTDAFRRLGGFADFGDPLANRASVDTEFQCRALLAGLRWAISREVVLRYRVHGQSATANPLTGWDSPARKKAQRLVTEYRKLQERGAFDPQPFGALAGASEMTERFPPAA